MSGRRSEDRYLSSSGPLKDISHRQLPSLARIESINSAGKSQLGPLIEENTQLRIKCAKIDEIESCANILMTNLEILKRKNYELESKVVELTAENEQLRADHKGGLKFLKEENLRKEGEVNGLRKKMEMNENFQLIRLEQELASEKQGRDRMLSNLQGKHKSEMSKLEHQFKLSLSKSQHEAQLLRAQVDGLVKDNTLLKAGMNELDTEVGNLVRENDHLQQELMRTRDVMIQAENQLNIQTENYGELKRRSDETIATLSVQLERTRIQLEKSASMQSMLQRMNAQLKNQGGVLILQNQEMKARTLQLQEINLINLSNIKNLQHQLDTMLDSSKYLENKMIENDLANKQLAQTIERQNIELRQTVNGLDLEVRTKRKEIEDLIMIVSNLENEAKGAAEALLRLEQGNARANQQLMEKEIKIGELAAELEACQRRLEEYSSLKNGVEHENNSIKDQLDRERQSVLEMEKLLEIEKQRYSERQLQYQRLVRELQEKERLNEGWKDGKQQYQKLFSQQKSQNIHFKQRISELENINSHLQKLLKESEESKGRIKEECEIEKNNTIQEGMQQMEQLISQKYDEILKEYQQHYDAKILTLEQEIKTLTNEIHST